MNETEQIKTDAKTYLFQLQRLMAGDLKLKPVDRDIILSTIEWLQRITKD